MRILFFLFFTFTCLAQNNDQRLAYQYFVDGDYEKAIVLYEEINKKKFSINTYNPYYTSLINLNRFSEAEKIARKQFAKNNSRLNFLADVIVARYKLNQKSSMGSRKFTRFRFFKKIKISNFTTGNKKYFTCYRKSICLCFKNVFIGFNNRNRRFN